jgi:putative hemolysin
MESYSYILVSLLASAFFSGMEIAFVSANKLEIEIIIKKQSRSGKILAHLYRFPGMFIGTMLLGNNIALVVYGILIAAQLDPIIRPLVHSPILLLLIQTILSTVFILVAAEFLPKALFRLNPKRWLVGFSWLLSFLYYLLWLPTRLTIGVAEWILRTVFKMESEPDQVDLGRIDLNNYIRERTDSKSEYSQEPEVEIFQNALDFRDVKVRECMIPRNEIAAISLEESKEIATQKFVDSGHSKLLVYRGTIDNIIGYIHSLEMFKKPESIKHILRPISIIPEAIAAKDVLEKFIHEKRNVAVVVDEFGGTAGMVTIEDVVEEIFGEIEDEFDKEQLIERKINDKNYILSARHEIDYLNSTLDFEIPESDEYETLSGYIIHHYEGLPEVGKLIETPGFFITILKVNGPKIIEVQLTVKNSDN